MNVLYVMGYGRSGSTLMDRLLGSYDDIVGCGELTNVAESGWVNNEFCSCSQRVRSCVFWSSVYDLWSEGKYSKDAKEFHNLKSKYETHKYFWKAAAGYGSLGEADYECYMHDLGLLYSSIHEVSGKKTIVDSSKNVSRAYNLSLLPTASTYFLHLVRDCRGVVYSLEKSHEKIPEKGVQQDLEPNSWARSVAAWSLYNYECEMLKKRIQDDTITIRYEDLTREPIKTLAKVEGLLGIPKFSDQAIDRLASGQADLHTVAGNRLRMKKGMKIKQDVSWHAGLPSWKRKAVELISPHLMKKYRYF